MTDPHAIPYRWKLAALAALVLIAAALATAAWFFFFSSEGPCASEAARAGFCDPYLPNVPGKEGR